jgi:hypothetical protein
MHPAVVGDDVGRHGEGASMALLGEHVHPDAGERSGRRHQEVVDAMNAPHHATDAVEVKPRRRRTRKHPGTLAHLDEGPYGLRRQAYVGVEVYARKRTADLVAEPDRARLPRNVGLDDPYRKLPRDVGRPVDARVGHDDDVELTRAGRREQKSEIRGDHGFLVVGRHHDTGEWSSGLDDNRVFPHVDLRTQITRAAIGVPMDRISVHGVNRAIDRQESLRQ